MKKRLYFISIFCIVFTFKTSNAQLLSINDSSAPESIFSPQELVDNILISGSCSSVTDFSSVVHDNPTDRTTKSYGYFKKPTGSSFPFNEGLILTTGKAFPAGNSSAGLLDNVHNEAGDIDLENALSQSDTFDATSFKFTFIPVTSTLSFRYIMASEEYNGSSECTYADSFAFLIREVGTVNYTNLAVLPDTTPVSVSTINNASACRSNPDYFEGYDLVDTNYGGRTKVLIASSDVTPNQAYEIKLVIADHVNGRYDSAVFLEGGSFNLGLNLGASYLYATNNDVCGDEVLLNANVQATSYKWYYNDGTGEVEILDVFGNSIDNIEYNANLGSGTYVVRGSISGCNLEDSIDVEFTDMPLTTSVTNLSDCKNQDNDFATFTLEDKEAEILNGQPSSVFEVQYYEDLNMSNQISSPYISSEKTIYVRIQNRFSEDCYNTTSFELDIIPILEFDIEETVITICENILPHEIKVDNPQGLYTYEWFDNNGDFIGNGQNVLITDTSSISTTGVVFTVTATDMMTSCDTTKSFTLKKSSIATFTDTDIITSQFNRDGNTIEILTENLGSGDYEYALEHSYDGRTWQDEPSFTGLLGGIYQVIIRDKEGCGTSLPLKVVILDYPRFFTPNNDGENDVWQLIGLGSANFTTSSVAIFDRFGKIIATVAPNEVGWNGTYNGEDLSASDYWFRVQVTNIVDGNTKEYKGHFSLIRR
jgi:gliding motility-associated-like protein